MRLALTFPAAFAIQEAPNDRLVATLPAAPGVDTGLPEAIVTFGPLQLAPDEPQAWHEAIAGGDLAAGTRAKLGRAIDHRTAVGWPLRLLAADVVTGDADEIVEVRLCAFFTFMEHAAAAVVRTRSRERMDAYTNLFVGILETGRPDWRGEPLCVAELFDLAPGGADAGCDAAQARFAAKDVAAALAGFRAVAERDPGDVRAARGVVRCLYALGRFDEGHAARRALRQRCATTADPRARLIDEYVFDQFDAGAFTVRAIETLRPPARASYAALTFRAFELRDGQEHPLPVAVVVELGARATAAGATYVVGVELGAQLRAVAALAQLPPYAELQREVARLLADALAAAAPH